jgi:tetratricopeptide (TPR) repeat protein
LIHGLLIRGLLLGGLAFGPALAQTGDRLSIGADNASRQLILQAEDLLAVGDSHRAYALLQPHEATLAGNILYDYLLGVAALDSGRIGEAIFSLQRALSVEPGFSGAKMELARAYFECGNPDLARPLFNQLLDESPPTAVVEVIRRYLQVIDNTRTTPRGRFLPYLELFSGYDSNANGSTDSQQFLGFALSPDNVETDSAFVEPAAGFDWFLLRSSRFGWLLNARASHRINPDASFVDATVVSALGGFNWQRKARREPCMCVMASCMRARVSRNSVPASSCRPCAA